MRPSTCFISFSLSHFASWPEKVWELTARGTSPVLDGGGGSGWTADPPVNVMVEEEEPVGRASVQRATSANGAQSIISKENSVSSCASVRAGLAAGVSVDIIAVDERRTTQMRPVQ